MSVKLWTSLIWPGCAMGKYSIKAKGFLFAVLRWGDKTGALPDWSPIAYVPIDPAGNGEFFFPGRRAIPHGVAYVWSECSIFRRCSKPTLMTAYSGISV